MNKKNVFLWTLYDFANSIAIIVFFLYFSQWLVVENKVADIWFNLLFVGSTLLLLLTGPIFASIADKIGVRMPFLKVVTTFMFLALLATSFLANFIQINQFILILTALSFLLANYFYQFSFTFYNAFIHEIAPLKLRGFISGIGQSANWSGQVVGLLITLPLATGAIYLVGNAGRSQTFLPATLLFFLLALPMLLFFKEQSKPKRVSINLVQEYKNSIKDFITLCKAPGMGRFLLGYFFFNDAMLTASNNFPIYLEQVFKISDKTKSALLVGILLTSAFGAFISGWLSDKIGLKKSLLGILIGWVIIFPLLAILTNFTNFTIVAVLMGFLFGATWTVTRAVMSYLSPPERLNHAFSYYTLAERFSTFVGPITWGLITLLLLHIGSLRYRIALMAMALFILMGLLIVKSIPVARKKVL